MSQRKGSSSMPNSSSRIKLDFSSERQKSTSLSGLENPPRPLHELGNNSIRWDTRNFGKRPVLISIIFGFRTIVLSLLFVIALPLTPLLREAYGSPYIFLILCLSLVDITACIGIWQMRKWGFYLCLLCTIAKYLGAYAFEINLGVSAYLGPVIYLGAGFVYLERMR